jgi:hypothetical protein
LQGGKKPAAKREWGARSKDLTTSFCPCEKMY